MAKGTIIQFKGRAGKIKGDDGKKYGFNKKAIVEGDFAQIKRGQRISFEPDASRAWSIHLLDEVVVPPPSRPEPTRQTTPSAPPNQARPETMGDFLNPYNFVRYLEQKRPSTVLGNCPPPPHDRYIGLTGRLTCRVKAVTPLFVSDSHAIKKAGEKDHYIHRFFEYDGQPALPASSLRGMVRSVFETVMNSCLSVFDGGGYDLRQGRLAKGLVPARVVAVDKTGAKLEILDCSKEYPAATKRKSGRNGREINLVNAASIDAYQPKVLNQRTKEHFDPALSDIPSGVKNGERVAALVDLDCKSKGRYQYFRIKKLVPVTEHTTLVENPGKTKKVFGYIHATGPNIENKHFERLFFRWGDTKSDDIPTWDEVPKKCRKEIKTDTVEEYGEHLKNYWERHGRKIEQLDKKTSWPVTAQDLPHPSYFIQKQAKLRKGDLVYYIPHSEKGFPVLRPILISRLPYKYSRFDLLENQASHLHRCTDYSTLCPTCRMFGWVHQKPDKDEKRYTAYAGRVRLNHATPVEGAMRQRNEDITLAILGSPKPTKTQFYLLNQNGRPQSDVDYNKDQAQLRGRKFYRHHGDEPSRNHQDFEYSRKTGQLRGRYFDGKDDQNRTVRGVVEKDSEFEFTLNFENLAPLELGALLWTLEMEEGMHHRLGYAKPLGFGSVTVRVTELETVNWEERLASLAVNAGRQENLDKKEDLVQKFKADMQAYYGNEFGALLEEIQAILSEHSEKLRVHYPRPGREPHVEGKNFKWFQDHKNEALDLAMEDDGLPI